MEIHDAIELLRDAVGNSGGVWADLGAGTGTFTTALGALLEDGSTIYAIDDDATAVRALSALPPTRRVHVVAVRADSARSTRSASPRTTIAALAGARYSAAAAATVSLDALASRAACSAR